MAKTMVTGVERRQVPARLEVALVDRVRGEALQHRRTLSAELGLLIEEALAARDTRNGTRRVRSGAKV